MRLIISLAIICVLATACEVFSDSDGNYHCASCEESCLDCDCCGICRSCPPGTAHDWKGCYDCPQNCITCRIVKENTEEIWYGPGTILCNKCAHGYETCVPGGACEVVGSCTSVDLLETGYYYFLWGLSIIIETSVSVIAVFVIEYGGWIITLIFLYVVFEYLEKLNCEKGCKQL